MKIRAYIKLFGTLIILLFSQKFSYAEPSVVQHTVHLHEDSGNNPDDDPKNNGRRDSQNPVTLYISNDGITISLIDKNEILSYEIADIHDNILYNSSDEMEFVSMIYSLTGEIKISLIMEFVTLSGYLEL